MLMTEKLTDLSAQIWKVKKNCSIIVEYGEC